MQMVWIISIHVIFEVADISLDQKHAYSEKFIFHQFAFCNCINISGMAEQWNY